MLTYEVEFKTPALTWESSDDRYHHLNTYYHTCYCLKHCSEVLANYTESSNWKSQIVNKIYNAISLNKLSKISNLLHRQCKYQCLNQCNKQWQQWRCLWLESNFSNSSRLRTNWPNGFVVAIFFLFIVIICCET